MQLQKMAVVIALALLCGLGSVTWAQAQSPDALGKAIADNELEAVKKINALMKDRPDPKDLTPKVKALKEETIRKMVALGQQVAALDGKSQLFVDFNYLQKIAPTVTDPKGVWEAFREGKQFYMKKDPNLGKLIHDFGYINEYAFFPTLKKKNPKEAERLGIK